MRDEKHSIKFHHEVERHSKAVWKGKRCDTLQRACVCVCVQLHLANTPFFFPNICVQVTILVIAMHVDKHDCEVFMSTLQI